MGNCPESILEIALRWRPALCCFPANYDTRVRFLLYQFMPVYGLFCFISLNATGKGNWPVPALVAGIVLLVVFWRGGHPGWRLAPMRL